MSEQTIPQVGERLDHYQLEELLAVGGMGLVFRAYDAPLDRYVAVKVLAPELAADEAIATQFVVEARAAATLSHPNVVHVYSVGQDRDLLYFAMELVQGDNLESLQRAVSQLNLGEAVQLIRQAALGLQHAHRRGIVHGDVKPANLVVTFAGVLKVTDFGLARRTTANQANDFGTPEYASPETISGQPTDHRSDIYALGATLYHLLAGRPPFTGSPDAILRQQLRDKPAPASKFNLKVSPALNRIILRCLEKKPADRYQSYEELVSDLDQFISGQQPAPRKETSARPTFVVAFFLALAISGTGLYLWKRSTENANKPGDQPSANHAPLPTAQVPPQQGSHGTARALSAEDEAMAQEAANALQSQADALIRAGKLAEAQAVYQQWPLQPLQATAKANSLIQEQREHIRRLALQEWRTFEKQATTLKTNKEFPAAMAVCEQAIQALKEFPKCVALAQEELGRIRQAQQRHVATLATEQAALEQRRQARLSELRETVTKLAINMQWEKAQEELRAANQGAEPELQPTIQQLQRQEVETLIALRTSIGTRSQAKPGPTMTLATRTGDVEGQLIAVDPERVTLGRVLPHGVISTPITWDSLAPLSKLRFFALAYDQADSVEQYGFAVLLSHFALTRLARLDDARRELQAAVQREPSRAAAVEPFLLRLAELERRLEQEAALRAAAQAKEDQAQFAWAIVESAFNAKDPEAVLRELSYFLSHHKESDCARLHQADLDRLQRTLPGNEPIAPYTQLDFGGQGQRTRLLQKVDGEEAQPFDGEMMFVTSGFLRKKGIPRHGLPDDGKVIVRLGDQRVPIQINGAHGDGALLLSSSGRRSVNIPLRGKAGKHSQIALLYAAAHQSIDFEVTAQYGAREESLFEFRIWDWQYQPESGDKTVAVLPVTASNKSRVSLGARLLAVDPTQRLEQIRLRVPHISDNPDAAVAILGIAVLPAK